MAALTEGNLGVHSSLGVDGRKENFIDELTDFFFQISEILDQLVSLISYPSQCLDGYIMNCVFSGQIGIAHLIDISLEVW